MSQQAARFGKRHESLAKCTTCSCCRGARFPGSNASSLSRGKKTLPTLGAASIGSRQRDTFSSIALHGALPFPSGLQSHPTLRTLGAFRGIGLFAPLSTRTRFGGFLQEVRFQLHHALMDLIFDFDKRRFRVGTPPFFHIA